MLQTLLRTKLYIPPLRPNWVPRPRLIERLNQGLQLGHKLTLISAPAGFGKTTLIAEWGLQIVKKNPQSAIRDPQLCWLSLDEKDSDPARFLAYFITALQTLDLSVPEGSKDTDLGESLLAALQSPQPPPPESILTVLLNEITAVSKHIIFVLDDYHLIDSLAVDNALTFLLDHLPPNMHLVIATREDPGLPLPRMRARGRLTELRVADLRFTPQEAAAFLNQVMGLNLSAGEIAALEKRTEGWIAGLQMAALSMQGRSDAAAFIQAFTGSHHFVLDYLLEEVLHRQPPGIQDFLLRTSILDRLCGPLCDALLLSAAPSGQETLEYLQQANLFLLPLDNERHWYRYHHLFADLLRRRLEQHASLASGERLADLHGRASIWYEENGLDIEAFQHAAAANDVQRAAHLLEGAGMPLHYRGAMLPVINWLASLPPRALDANPSLWVTYATALTLTGRPVSDVEAVLQAAERALQGSATGAKKRDLSGQIASIRGMLAVPQGQVETILDQSRRALELLSPDNLPARTAATWALGLAFQLQGDYAAASQAYTQAIANSEASGNIMFAIASATSLGQIKEAETQLPLATENYRRVLQLAGDPPLPAATEAYLGLARVGYEWNDLPAARELAQQALHLARQMENVDTPAACLLLLARLELVAGDSAAAAARLSEAEQFARTRGFTHYLPGIFTTRVRLLLYQGDLAGADNLAQEYELPLSQARVRLAQGDPPAALSLLESWSQALDAPARPDEQLKEMVLRAVVLQACSREEEALQVLAAALALAEPGGTIRTFVEEGQPMAELLSTAAAQGIMPAYTARLLSAIPTAGAQEARRSRTTSGIVEPLSPRELEVLQLIAQGLSNREIGERLFLALDTIKGHNRQIFSKLGVHRRTEAVARARELGLL